MEKSLQHFESIPSNRVNPDPCDRPLQPDVQALLRLDTLRLVLLSGKGGVGKTTLSCAIARHCATHHLEERILLLSTDPAHSLADVLQMVVTDVPQPLSDRPNLHVRALDAKRLLDQFKQRYGQALELLVERGSFVEGGDLTPVWDLDWPGLDELMGLLEIQRLLQQCEADRIIVDMAPSGHTLNLLGLMDFLDNFLRALELFQTNHRTIARSLTGQYVNDQADVFLEEMQADLTAGRQLLQDREHTACFVVAIAESMSWLETRRLCAALKTLHIPIGALLVNRILPWTPPLEDSVADRLQEQQELLQNYLRLGETIPVFTIPQQISEPIGGSALDALIPQIQLLTDVTQEPLPLPIRQWPQPVPPGFGDFVSAGRQLVLVGGKGGVGKTTVAAAIAYAMASQHPQRAIRVISIDPAHSLGDAYGQPLHHNPTQLMPNLTAQEIDATVVLDQFRQEYLWELADMMGGDRGSTAGNGTKLAYLPEAWRQITDQALPGLDEMLSLITVVNLLEQHQQDLIILDTAPTGHLLRFLEMPSALADWLAWIFKLWIKYQAVVGRMELMGRLRTLRQQVVQTQKKLQDPQFTEFIAVVQNQSAILAETQRLTTALTALGIAHRYVVHNRYQPGVDLPANVFPQQTIVRLPEVPRSLPAVERIIGISSLLFSG